ncbi:MAG: DUF5916 domain-containing protein, partial [Fidelibacterota bacterium]
NIPSIFSQAGYLIIKQKIVGSKGNIQFLPYIVAFQNGSLENPDDPSSAFDNELGWPTVGLSAKYGIASNLTLDLAVNPDYSQIESDAVMIDVNTTYALYYPEKRPFFLEGIDMFESEINAVYTRSINDPLIAARLTGKIGRTNIGYIIAGDQHTPWTIPFEERSYSVSSDRKSVSNVLRIKQDILEDSFLGFILTDREVNESFNRVTGFDGRIKFLKNYFLSFQGLGSWTGEPDDSLLFAGASNLTFGNMNYTSAFDGERFNGAAYEFGLSRSARLWNFSTWFNSYSPEFRADNGFIGKNNYREAGLWTGLHFYPNKWGIVETQPQVSAGIIRNFNGILKHWWINPNIWINFIRQTHFSMWSSLGSERYEDTMFKGKWSLGMNLNNSYSKAVVAGIWLGFGKSINYYADPPALGFYQNIGLWGEVKPIEKFRASISFNRYEMLESRGGKKSLYQDAFRNTLTYQFSKHLSFRLVAQYKYTEIAAYDYEKYEFQIDPLISYELNPFTVFYIGSNHDLEKFDVPYGTREKNHQIFLKLQYQFRSTPDDLSGKVRGLLER